MPSLKSQKAFQFSVENFNQSLYMWTFTWPNPAPDVADARKLWGKFLSGGSPRAKTLMNAFPTISGLRVFEMHPGKTILGQELSHGLHVQASFAAIGLHPEWEDEFPDLSSDE